MNWLNNDLEQRVADLEGQVAKLQYQLDLAANIRVPRSYAGVYAGMQSDPVSAVEAIRLILSHLGLELKVTHQQPVTHTLGKMQTFAYQTEPTQEKP